MTDCWPALRPLAVKVAVPLAPSKAVPKTMPPSVNVTVPVGTAAFAALGGHGGGVDYGLAEVGAD